MIAAAAFAAVGCSDWMTPEAEVFDEYSLTEVARDDAYYEALRAYKESDHAIAFGWYDGWGEPGVSTANMLSAAPDSMDIISLWNNSRPLSDVKKDDLRFVQEKKGTKVLIGLPLLYTNANPLADVYIPRVDMKAGIPA